MSTIVILDLSLSCPSSRSLSLFIPIRILRLLPPDLTGEGGGGKEIGDLRGLDPRDGSRRQPTWWHCHIRHGGLDPWHVGAMASTHDGDLYSTAEFLPSARRPRFFLLTRPPPNATSWQAAATNEGPEAMAPKTAVTGYNTPTLYLVPHCHAGFHASTSIQYLA